MSFSGVIPPPSFLHLGFHHFSFIRIYLFNGHISDYVRCVGASLSVLIFATKLRIFEANYQGKHQV